jgi:hypothetical protein
MSDYLSPKCASKRISANRSGFMGSRPRISRANTRQSIELGGALSVSCSLAPSLARPATAPLAAWMALFDSSRMLALEAPNSTGERPVFVQCAADNQNSLCVKSRQVR